MSIPSRDASKPDDLRQVVLDASVKLIESEGLAALSLRRVAKEAGVSHQAPYHHFGNREAILAALAAEGFVALSAVTRSAASAHTAAERVRAAVRGYVQLALEKPAHFRLMFRPELVNLSRHPGAKAAAEDALAALGELAQRIQQARAGTPLSVEALADTLWSTCHGASCLLLDGMQAEGDPARAEAFTSRVADALANLMDGV